MTKLVNGKERALGRPVGNTWVLEPSAASNTNEQSQLCRLQAAGLVKTLKPLGHQLWHPSKECRDKTCWPPGLWED